MRTYGLAHRSDRPGFGSAERDRRAHGATSPGGTPDAPLTRRLPMASPAPPRTRSTSSAGTAPARASAPPTGRPAAPCVTGHYRLDPHNAAWWWSPEMFELLGLPAEGVQPSTELLLQCLHRDDRARILQAISTACAAGRPFAVESRVLRRDGSLRVVVLHGHPTPGARGAVTTVEGECVDITDGRLSRDDAVVAALQTEIAQLRTAMASRAT